MGSFTWEALIAMVTGTATVVLALVAVGISRRQTKYAEEQTKLSGEQTRLSGKITDLELNKDSPILVPVRVWKLAKEERRGLNLSTTYAVEVRNARVGPALRVHVESLSIIFRVAAAESRALSLESDLIQLRLDDINGFLPMIWSEPAFIGFDLPGETGTTLTPISISAVKGSYETCHGTDVPWEFKTRMAEALKAEFSGLRIKDSVFGEIDTIHPVVIIKTSTGHDISLVPQSVHDAEDRAESNIVGEREFLADLHQELKDDDLPSP